MRQFLLYGHVLSTEEAELYADYELKKNPPTLDNFKEQVRTRRVHTGRGSDANSCERGGFLFWQPRSQIVSFAPDTKRSART